MEASSNTDESAASNSRWGRATSDAGDDGREALSELAASYYYCVYAWWRRAGHEAEAAAAATLASFARWLGDAPPRRTDSGSERMRTWLLERLVELSGETLEAPAAPPLFLDPQWAESRYADEPPGEPDAILQRRWALTVLEFTVATMSAEYAARGEEALFPELLSFAGFDSGEEDRYAAAAARIGRTIGAMHKEVFDFRHRQRELLLFFAGDTLLDPEQAQSEITALLCACDAPGPEAATARLPTAIGSVHPDEMLARAMQSVRMTGGGANGWQPPTVAEAARLFPQYEVCALLGRGGMGAVYQGRQTELDRLVAIKLLPLEVSVDRNFADRFRREARAMAKLQHPNIIDVHDFGTTAEGHLYFVMEYVDGANLDAMIRGPGLEPAQALEIIGSVCDALAYAHAEGVVHRDIKPANVMVSTRGRVKVADFGLARLTDSGPEQLGHTVTGTVMGTPDYMAPEQKRGMNVDHRADIYSLGVMLYEMLCREVPQGIFDPPSHRVAVDSRVDQVVIKAMQQQPDRRYQSTQEMKTAVTEASVPQPKALALARLPLGGLSRAMTMLAPGAAPRSKKKPLFAGLGFLAIGAAALFYLQPWKKSAPPSPSPASDVAAPSIGAVTPAAVPKTAAFGPWQPLFTEAEWKQTVPGQREVVDGRMHVIGPCEPKAQPSADGAIRARIQFQQGMKYVGFDVRRTKESDLYKAHLASEKVVVLEYYQVSRKVGTNLGRYYLPKTLQPGDTLLLELRMQGDRLTLLVDGAVAIEARDSRLSEPGQWGITGNNGWFESVEVQTPLPAAAPVVNPFGPWQPLFTEAEWKESKSRKQIVDGRMNLQGGQQLMKPLPAADGAIRARIRLPEPGKYAAVNARALEGSGVYKLQVSQGQGSTVLLEYYPWGGKGIELGRKSLSKPFQPGDTLLLELRLQGDHLTVLTDGAVVIEAQDSHLPGPGEWGIIANDGWFESVEVQTPTTDASGVPTFGGHRYQFVPGSVSWTDAKAKAEAMGGHLATITSKAEHDWIVATFGDRLVGNEVLWLGGVRDSAAGAWRWITGEPFEYTNWQPTQPNSINFPAFIVQYLHRAFGADPGWNDLDFLNQKTLSAIKGFLVEWDSPAGPPVATKDAPFVNTLGMKFVPVPIVGGPTAGKTVLFSVWETRVQDYEAFVTETKRAWQKWGFEQGPTHPAVLVSWDDAHAFCAWLTERERKAGGIGPQDSYRLPSDHEWSCAAGIADREDPAATPEQKDAGLPDVYAWGSVWPPPPGAGNFNGMEIEGKALTDVGAPIEGYRDDFPSTAPVGSFPPNRWRLYDLSGNVWERCEDLFRPGGTTRVVRGAAFSDQLPAKLKLSCRLDRPPDHQTIYMGIRVVLATAAAPTAAANPPPTAATKDTPFVNSLGMKFVPVPGTDVLFCIHETRKQDYAAYARGDAAAAEKAKEFALKFGAGPNDPLPYATWDDAQAFCAWLSRTEGRTYRLPTDREWSYAVGIGDQEKWNADTTPATVNQVPDQFPWGTGWPPPKGAGNYRDETYNARNSNADGNYIQGYDDGFNTFAPVMSFTPNRLGLYDLGGNAWEWVADWYDASKSKHTLRGADYFASDPDRLLSSRRYAPNPTNPGYGFRVVLVPPAPVAKAAPASATTPAAATKARPFANSLGMKFVPVPIVGGPTAGKTVLFSVWDTRVQDYAVFATETKRERSKPGYEQGPTHPAAGVNWDDATTFCAWLTERERKTGGIGAREGYRLPSDHEWSCAVGIGEQEDAAKLPNEKTEKLAAVFPWGTAWPPPDQAGNYGSEELRPLLAAGKYAWIKDVLPGRHDGFAETSPVGSYAANRLGLYDMGGNVWQWCSDSYDKAQKDRVLRGPSWERSGGSSLLSSSRLSSAPAIYGTAFGFRVVLALPAETASATTPATAATSAEAPNPATTSGAPAR